MRDEFWNFWPSGLLIRTPSFIASGGFIEDLGRFSHWEDFFYACVLSLSDVACVSDDALIHYRVHEHSCSSRATGTGKTIVDERVGLQWLAAYLRSHTSPYAREVAPLIQNRLAANRARFAQARHGHALLETFANLYEPHALRWVDEIQPDRCFKP